MSNALVELSLRSTRIDKQSRMGSLMRLHPAPLDDLENAGVGLQHFVAALGLVIEFIGPFDHCKGWAHDQIVRLAEWFEYLQEPSTFCLTILNWH
ncbi:hypothetical protein [Paracoccus methylarcula]|uniref:hypothetical protein n=1 Tax=Paracoccus methylarcula TaxID=72022 RepID=UPI000D108184|nr:hypothetical protein [Paracoccus methylarcula]